MKNIFVSLVIFLVGSLALNSCRSTCDQTVYYNAKIPVYGSLNSIRTSFAIQGVQPMDSIVNIVELDHAYFLEEKNKGVHVIDKKSFTSPTRTAFINAPGCLSIAGSGTTLYIGQATDLLTIDVADLNNITKTKVVQNLFNEDFVKEDSFIIGYRSEYVEWVIEDRDCGDTWIYPDNAETASRTSQIPMMDLHISKNHLLACDNKIITSFGINTSGNLALNASMTTFSSNRAEQNKIGSTEDFIVVGNPTVTLLLLANDGILSRVFSSFVSSAFTCGDFYMFNDAMLYPDFTADNNGNCSSVGALHIHPINGSARPFMPFQVQFSEPQYVSFSDSTMLLCDGSSGFSLFDISSPSTFSSALNKFDGISDFSSQVSVLSKDRALVWGEDGLFYINVADPRNISVISEIK